MYLFQSNIYYRFLTTCNTSSHNDYNPLHYIATRKIKIFYGQNL